MTKNFWLFFVAKRFQAPKKNGFYFANSFLPTIGIAAGVLSLVVVLSVMNGFQASSIDAILEIDSFHLQTKVQRQRQVSFESFCNSCPYIKSFLIFKDKQAVGTSVAGKISYFVARGVSFDMAKKDPVFLRQLDFISGGLEIDSPTSVVLGSTLARNMGATLGCVIEVYLLESDTKKSLFNVAGSFEVTGIFHCGYENINETMAFFNIEGIDKEKSDIITYGIKLKNKNLYKSVINLLKNANLGIKEKDVSCYQDYNQSFFGALRIEKNTILLLLSLIFVIVGINIYNWQNKVVSQKKQDLCVLCALGAKKKDVTKVFLLEGIKNGLLGGLIGLVLGLLISVNMGHIFCAVSFLQYYIEYFVAMLFSPGRAPFVRENTVFLLYASIPCKITLVECAFIFMFALVCSVASTFFAAKKILNFDIQEVLHAS